MNCRTVLASLAVLLVHTAVCKYSFDEFHKFFVCYILLHKTSSLMLYVIRIKKLLNKDLLEESFLEKTRMHSSRMRAYRSLQWPSRGRAGGCPGGVCLRGVCV